MTNPKAPYIPIAWLDAFFALIKRIRLGNVDRHLIAQYDICSLGNASKVVAALKFLRVIDEKGKAIENNLKGLKLEGESRKDELKRIVKEAYSDLIEKIDLSHAKREDLVNYFIGTYSYSLDQANSSTKLFLHLVGGAGIETSEELAKASRPSKKGRPTGIKNKLKRTISKPTKKEITNIFPRSEKGSINIQIKGEGVGLDLNLNSVEDIKPNLDIILQILTLNLKKKTESEHKKEEPKLD